MQRALERLDQWLAIHRPDFVARRPPGVEVPAPRGDIPDAARAWFRWQNGALDPADRAGLVAGWQPLGWEASRAAADLAARDPDTLDDDWRAEWVPIAAHVEGGLLVLDAVAALGEADAVVEVLPGSSLRVVHAPSLAVWLNALAETLEAACWSPDADGVWNPTPENPDLWNQLVLEPPGYPRRHDASWERAPSLALPLDWLGAYAHALVESAVESLWLGVPRGDVALGVRLGAPLDAALARIDAAPADRRAGELAPLAAVLRASSDPRATEVAARWLGCATPFDALEALARAHLDDPSLREALVARTAAWARGRQAGSVAWALAFSEALAPVDVAAATAVRRWRGRLRSGRLGVTAERLIVATATAAADPVGAGASVDDALRDVQQRALDDACDAALVDVAVRAAVATGRVDALLGGWTVRDDRRCFAAMAALVRAGELARAAALPDEVSSTWLGDALALHLADLTDQPLDDRALRALQADVDEASSCDAAARAAVFEARTRHHLRRGDRDAALALRARYLGARQRDVAAALADSLARVPEAPAGPRAVDAEAALAALRPWHELAPNPFALTELRRLLPRVLRADATAAAPLRNALTAAARRVAASV